MNSKLKRQIYRIAVLFLFGMAVAQSAKSEEKNGNFILKKLDDSSGLVTYNWKIPDLKIENVSEKDGRKGITIGGKAEVIGAKADFPALQVLPPGIRKISVMVKSPEDAGKKPAKFALAGVDSENENIMVEVPIDWTGWKKIEIIPATASWKPSYKQEGKNGKFDPPLKTLNLCWFSSAEGVQELSFSEITAEIASPSPDLTADYPDDNLRAMDSILPGESFSCSMAFNNTEDKESALSLEYVVFPSHNSEIPVCADAKWGDDIANGCQIKTLSGTETLSEYALNNRSKNLFSQRMASKKNGEDSIKEMTQIIDLGKSAPVKRFEIFNSDANWIYMADISGSTDGVNYENIPDLTGIRMFHQWAGVRISSQNDKPFRYIKLRYHTKGLGEGTFGPGNVTDGGGSTWFKLPCIIKVFDGVNGEDTSLSSSEEKELFRNKVSFKIAPLSWERVKIEVPAEKISSQGCYIIGRRLEKDGKLALLEYSRFFVWKPVQDRPKDTPFGVNLSSSDKENAMLGMTNGRFENMKWFMCSSEKGKYAFDGSVAPWHVNQDKIITGLAQIGINPLPMMLGVPKYASTQPDEKRFFLYPPKDPADYRQFAFQTAARYGSKKLPEDKLLTNDKKTGLNLIRHFEIWNEPDLNHPQWGALVGTFEDYFPILRAGYEGVKEADKDAFVLNGGLAGFGFARWEALRKFKYADGKSALDFIDIMNIHHYCGQKGPEQSSGNTNIDRSASVSEEPPFYEQLKRLCQWRDKYKPGAPIWITEIGWDTIGGNFVSETDQAAYLVRTGILSLAYGAEKVFIYREKDSGNTLFASCGFLRKDNSFKPSAFAYSDMIREIQGAKCIGRIPEAENVFAFLFKKGDGSNLVTAWAPSGTSMLKLSDKPISVTDSFGFPLQHDSAEIKLSAFPVYVAVSDSIAGEMTKKIESQKAEDALKNKLESERKAVLIDFGTNEFPAYCFMGYMRPYEIVDSSCKWADGQKFGFVKGAKQCETKKWMKDPLLCDSVRSEKQSEFKISVPAGKYKVRYGINPFDKGKLKILQDGAPLMEVELPVDDGKNVFDISAGANNSVLSFTVDGYCNWIYIEAIENSNR